jgi:ankyrin repeat protein
MILSKDKAALDRPVGGYTINITPLHYAVDNDIDSMVKYLLDRYNPSTTKVDGKGRTAFMIAVEHNNTQMMRYFRNSRNFQADKPADDGVPPLLWAIQTRKSYSLISEILQFRGAVYSEDSRGNGIYEYLEAYPPSNSSRLKQEVERIMASESALR